jgi:hypothetical protein
MLDLLAWVFCADDKLPEVEARIKDRDAHNAWHENASYPGGGPDRPTNRDKCPWCSGKRPKL